MEDLSPRDPVSALVPSSMEATGSHSFDNRAAMSAPGGDPASAPGPDVSPPPRVETISHPLTALEPFGAYDPAPWRRADGSPWQMPADEDAPGQAPPGGWEQS